MAQGRRASAPGRRRAAAALAAALALVAFAALGVGCRDDAAPPPRSPFDDRAVTPAPTPRTTPAARTPVATPGVAPTPPTPVVRPPGMPGPVDRELALGKAIEQVAQWLGLQQSDLVLQSYEERSFPNSCVGVERPDIACAQVITPGVRVVLRDGFGHAHEARADAPLRFFAWAPQTTARGLVVEVDAAAGTLTLDTGRERLALRRVPGTVQGVQLTSLRLGAEVVVGLDRAPRPGESWVIAWIARP